MNGVFQLGTLVAFIALVSQLYGPLHAMSSGNQFGVSPSYRNYCQPATGTASANCRPGTRTKMSSMYRTHTRAREQPRSNHGDKTDT